MGEGASPQDAHLGQEGQNSWTKLTTPKDDPSEQKEKVTSVQDTVTEQCPKVTAPAS